MISRILTLIPGLGRSDVVIKFAQNDPCVKASADDLCQRLPHALHGALGIAQRRIAQRRSVARLWRAWGS